VAAFPFSKGYASACVELSRDGPRKWGLLDTSGRWALLPQFDECSRFLGGIALVYVNGYHYILEFKEGRPKYNQINLEACNSIRESNVTISLRLVSGFSEGLAVVAVEYWNRYRPIPRSFYH